VILLGLVTALGVVRTLAALDLKGDDDGLQGLPDVHDAGLHAGRAEPGGGVHAPDDVRDLVGGEAGRYVALPAVQASSVAASDPPGRLVPGLNGLRVPRFRRSHPNR